MISKLPSNSAFNVRVFMLRRFGARQKVRPSFNDIGLNFEEAAIPKRQRYNGNSDVKLAHKILFQPRIYIERKKVMQTYNS